MNKQHTAWEIAAGALECALASSPFSEGGWRRHEMEVIIKEACEVHAKAVTAERDELLRRSLVNREVIANMTAENAALRAQVKRLREALEDARGCLCAHKYPMNGTDFQSSPWFEEREKTLNHIKAALADTQQEQDPLIEIIDKHHRLAAEVRFMLHNRGAEPNLSQLQRCDALLREIAGLPPEADTQPEERL